MEAQQTETIQGCPVPRKARAQSPGTLWAKVRKLGFHPRAPACHGGLCAGKRLKCASVAHLGHCRVNVCLPGADRKALQTSGSGQTHSCLTSEARKGDCLRVFIVERAEKWCRGNHPFAKDSGDQDSPSAGPRAQGPQ